MNPNMKTKSPAAYTAGPWRTNGSQVTCNGDWKLPVCIIPSREDVRPTADALCKTRSAAFALAEQIAREHNSHAGLIAALERIQRIGETQLVHVHPSHGSAPHEVALIARGALAKIGISHSTTVDTLCPVCAIGFILPSGTCDHCDRKS